MDINDFSDFDDETLQKMAQLGLNPSKIDDKQLQLRLAAALRNKPATRGTMAGDVYIPPSPVDTVLDSYDRISGMKDQKDAIDSIKGLRADQQDSILDFLKKYKKSQPYRLPTGSLNALDDDSLFGANPGNTTDLGLT